MFELLVQVMALVRRSGRAGFWKTIGFATAGAVKRQGNGHRVNTSFGLVRDGLLTFGLLCHAGPPAKL